MGSEIIEMLQMGIYIILAIMIGLVGIYIYVMSKHTSKKNNYNQTNYRNDNEQYFEDDSMEEFNPSSDDDGPIQNL